MDNTNEILEQMNGKEFKADPQQARMDFVDRSVKCYVEQNKPIPEKAPEFVHHGFQVPLISKHIVRLSNLAEAEKNEAEKESEVQGSLHDIGRAEGVIGANPNHPEDGYRTLKKLGYPDEIAEFALDHDQWGLGRSIPGRQDNVELAKNNPQALLEKYDKKYGIAGIATIVADLSKEYSDPNFPHLPSIAPLTQDLADRLIKRQIANGKFKEGDEKFQTEKLGIKFMFMMVNYLNDKYGVNYEQAVENAKKEWDESGKKSMEELWTNNSEKAKSIDMLQKQSEKLKVAA